MNKPKEVIPTPKIPLELLKRMKSSYDEILFELSKLMSDKMLTRISSADYGYKKKECFEYLKEITSTQKIPLHPKFILIECLELTRWLKPNNKEEHTCRAFSCVLLLILENKSEYCPIGEINDVLAPLIDSIIFLKIAQFSTQKLIVWRILDDYHKELEYYLEDEEDKKYIEEITINPFLIYSLLLMMIVNKNEQKNIDKIVDWSIDMEKVEKNIPPFHKKSYINPKDLEKPYLLATSGDFDQYHDLWVKISEKMSNFISFNYPELTNNRLENILDCIGNRKAMNF